MTDSFKKLQAAVLALGPEEQAALLQMLLTVLQPKSGIADAPSAYLVKGELPMEKQVQYLADRLKYLSPAKLAEVGDFIEFLHQREKEQAVRKDYAQASESAFAAVWDNNEDALYDKL